MKCEKCKQAIGPTEAYREYQQTWQHHLVCPTGAERSEVAQPCVPSASCSAPAGAGEGQIADTSSRSAPASGPRRLSADEERIIKEESFKAVEALNRLDFHEGNLRKQQRVANAMWDAYERLKALDSPPAVGERAQVRNQPS